MRLFDARSLYSRYATNPNSFTQVPPVIENEGVADQNCLCRDLAAPHQILRPESTPEKMAFGQAPMMTQGELIVASRGLGCAEGERRAAGTGLPSWWPSHAGFRSSPTTDWRAVPAMAKSATTQSRWPGSPRHNIALGVLHDRCDLQGGAAFPGGRWCDCPDGYLLPSGALSHGSGSSSVLYSRKSRSSPRIVSSNLADSC